MYALVHDIEAYPQFLPWCEATEVISLSEDRLCGRIAVARAGIHQSFATCNRLVPYERIELQLQEGPFRRLHGIWQFLALRDDASKVSLRMEFEFSGRLINLAFGPVFSHIADSLVEAFSKRAREVYRDR
jgi:ribosome-associated toxin RatA of RatAB toxin-antitoxin module